MCEIDQAKQKYLLQAFPDVPLFSDMKTLHRGRAHEVRSNMTEEVPEALGFLFFVLLWHKFIFEMTN